VCLDALPVVSNLVDGGESQQTHIPVTVEPLVEVPANTGGKQKKSHKKKAPKAKYLTGKQYQPPQELLVSIAEKISPPQLRLLEDTRQFIPLNLPGPKKL
jgi:hypothetical protein